MRYLLFVAMGLAVCAALGCDSETRPPTVTQSAPASTQPRSQVATPGFEGLAKDPSFERLRKNRALEGLLKDSPQNIGTLDVQDGDGNATTLTIGPTDKVVAVASWCPHTKSFVRAISDPSVRQELKAYKWTFVLESDEWPAVRSQLEGEKDIDDQIRRLKARAGNGPLFDPEFLDTLPGKFYYFPPGYRQKDFGFPSTYSVELKRFDKNPVVWLATKSRRAIDLYFKFEGKPNPLEGRS
jgi:hypothetical protein